MRWRNWIAKTDAEELEIMETPKEEEPKQEVIDPNKVKWILNTCTSPDNLRTIHFTIPVEAKRQHFIESIHCSFNVRRMGYLTVRNGTDFLLSQFVHTDRDINFKYPGLGTGFERVAQITLTAGPEQLTDDLIGTLTVVGYTIDY